MSYNPWGGTAVPIECIECTTRTLVDDDDEAFDTPCPTCEDNGDDPFCVTVVQVEPCPNGEDCSSDDHHHGTGMHHVEAER